MAQTNTHTNMVTLRPTLSRGAKLVKISHTGDTDYLEMREKLHCYKKKLTNKLDPIRITSLLKMLYASNLERL